MISQVEQLFGEIDDVGHQDMPEIDEKDKNFRMPGMDADVRCIHIISINIFWYQCVDG